MIPKVSSLLLIISLFCLQAKSQSSPIAQGKWVKLQCNADGVYRVSFADLQNYGLDPASMDPRKLQLLGQQGGMLPEINDARPPGLIQNAIHVEGENDGVFNATDYILFYAEGPHKWNWQNNEYQHLRNIYADNAFYYLGTGAANGLRISSGAGSSQNPDLVIDKRDYLYFHDSDIINPVHMGRTFVGEKMGNESLSRNFNMNFPGNLNPLVKLKLSLGNASKSALGSMRVRSAGLDTTMLMQPLDEDNLEFELDDMTRNLVLTGGQFNLMLDYTRANNSSAAYLDYFEIHGTQPIMSNGEPMLVLNRDFTRSKYSEIRNTGTANQIWNVTDPFHPQSFTMSDAGAYRFLRMQNDSQNRKVVLFESSKGLKPLFIGSVAAQNLSGSAPVELIIVAPPEYLDQAKRLADFRLSHDGYSSLVVTPQQLYTEFSSGQQDPVGIRDFIKLMYNKGLTAPKPLKWVLLMGSASFDYKDRVPENTNKVPGYQFDSYVKTINFMLDDFYAYIKTGQGRPTQNPGDNKMMVSVGRIPARNAEQAKIAVDKLIQYTKPESLGEWRRTLSMVCDDVDANWETMFVTETEQFSKVLTDSFPDFNLNKIYADAFKQESTGNRESYPEVQLAINRGFENGSLIMNYQGHGGERGWAQEEILTVPMILAHRNINNLPVLFTATCDFSRFDDPALQSGGEYSMFNPQGGAIALLSTTRLVFVNGNSVINNAFWTEYGFPKPDEPIPTLGEIYRNMKNRPNNANTEDNKFALLGDPSMTMAFPQDQVIIDSINGIFEPSYDDTLKAFSVVRLKGHIKERLGGKDNNFNGQLWVTVYDKAQNRKTLNSDGAAFPLNYSVQTSVIYKGVVSVVNGGYSVVFVVPKDISYKVDWGKISLYAHNGEKDASGSRRVKIGSSETKYVNDQSGPAVRLFMNDTFFRNGGNTLPDSRFLALIYDSSGLNSTGAGIGRDMEAILDPGTEKERRIIMNEFFTYDLNSFTRGMIRYDFSGLSLGSHKIRLKVWDVYNNSGESTLEFVVLAKERFIVTRQYPMPNPFSKKTAFVFEHNMAGRDIWAEVGIFDPRGNKVAGWSEKIIASLSKEISLDWDGTTMKSGMGGSTELPKGIYIYKVILRNDEWASTSFSGKIIKN